jgi:serine protease
VINLSVAADFKTSIEENVYQQIYERSGALIVAAAGNSGSPQKSYPASHDSVISVASVDSQLRRSFWSQYNDQVELAAPGSNIHTTNADESTIDLFSGTSFACPFVSGIATKIWAAHPECTNEDIRMAMRESAFRLGDGVPNTQFGYGLVQAVDANDYLIENFDCAVAETSQPTATPSADPTPSPTPIPCQHYLESCVADSDCCDGYTCRRRSSDSDISWVCRSETTRKFEAKPKLANVDGNCRGGFAGGCINVS